jgi:hypothetical protein
MIKKEIIKKSICVRYRWVYKNRISLVPYSWKWFQKNYIKKLETQTENTMQNFVNFEFFEF